jgi:cyclopropane-fatty-acyl-phospholipid synthase
LPAITDVCRRYTNLRVRNVQAFGEHYAQTLRLWRERFVKHSGGLSALGFDETFRRTWELYLAYCEAGFRARHIDVHHLTLERPV